MWHLVLYKENIAKFNKNKEYSIHKSEAFKSEGKTVNLIDKVQNGLVNFWGEKLMEINLNGALS